MYLMLSQSQNVIFSFHGNTYTKLVKNRILVHTVEDVGNHCTFSNNFSIVCLNRAEL